MVFVVGDSHKIPNESDEKPETGKSGKSPERKAIRSIARKFRIEKESGELPVTEPKFGAVKIDFGK